MIGHTIAVLRYYLWRRRVRILTDLTLDEALAAIARLRGAEGLNVHVTDAAAIVISSTVHCGNGMRGRPLIPFLRGALRATPEGVVFEGALAIEPVARAMVTLFAAVILMAWAAIANSFTRGHGFAGLLTTGLFWGMLEVGYWIGEQDRQQLIARLTEALGGGPAEPPPTPIPPPRGRR